MDSHIGRRDSLFAVGGASLSAVLAIGRDIVPALLLERSAAATYLTLSLIAQLVYVTAIGETAIPSQLKSAGGLRPRVAFALLGPIAFAIVVAAFLGLAPRSTTTSLAFFAAAGFLPGLLFRYLADLSMARIIVSGVANWTLASPVLQNLWSVPFVVLLVLAEARVSAELLLLLLGLAVSSGYIVHYLSIRRSAAASAVPPTTSQGHDVARSSLVLELARLPEPMAIAQVEPSSAVTILVARRVAGGLANSLVVPLGQLLFYRLGSEPDSGDQAATKGGWRRDSAAAFGVAIGVVAGTVGGWVLAMAVAAGTLAFAIVRPILKLSALRSTLHRYEILLAALSGGVLMFVTITGSNVGPGLGISAGAWIALLVRRVGS